MSVTVCTAFGVIIQLGNALGVRDINQLPGCWEHAVDDQWRIALNGHGDERTAFGRATVPPYHIYVEYNGWPAGLIGPAGGVIAAGDGATEDTFIAAVEAARDKAVLA